MSNTLSPNFDMDRFIGSIDVRLTHLEDGLSRLLHILDGNENTGLVASHKVMEARLMIMEDEINNRKKQWAIAAAFVTGLSGLVASVASMLGVGKH